MSTPRISRIALDNVEYDDFHEAIMTAIKEENRKDILALPEDERNDFIQAIYVNVTSWLFEHGVIIYLNEK